MQKKTFIVLSIILIIIAIGAFWLYKVNNKPIAEKISDSPITLYYRNDCPHCQNVEKFIEENNVEQKVAFSKKEVGLNKKNADELLEKAKQFNLKLDAVGVPFLWDGQKAILGDQDIINFFKDKIGGK